MRNRTMVIALAVTSTVGLLGLLPTASAKPGGALREYVVQYANGASAAEGRAAVQAAGGSVVDEIGSIGVAKVVSRNANFVLDASAAGAIAGAARNRIIGYAAPALRKKVDRVEALTAASKAEGAQAAATAGAEPLAGLQWDMDMIDATTEGSYASQPGDPRTLVGIIDTGIDASHPDLNDNVNTALSRNFTTDIPLIDGPCEAEPDHSCSDPATVDEGGHGTHVAGTVAAELNGLGIAGVAPNVTLVNLRAGQDSGFFFLFETLEAYTSAADQKIDVVNMSFFTDPWWANCRDNPLDSPAEQEEQAAVIDMSNEALDYAYAHGVTLVASAGNEHTDMDDPTYDNLSPDYPPGNERVRDNITNACMIIPTEGHHVLSISALGPTERKAYYSNYGTSEIVVSAPGGDRREFFGTPQYNAAGNRVLSTYPAALAIEEGLISKNYKPLTPLAVVDCQRGRSIKSCGVYVYLQGTSMASPHVTGVAALIVSEFGSGGGRGFGLAPATVEQTLRDTATDHACPTVSSAELYPDLVGADPNVPFEDQVCVGDADFNSWYGDGIANALEAVS
jgi:lantibiotic leader peptide-processing serine protease